MAFLSCRCHLQVSRDLGHSRVGSQVIFPNSSHGSGDAYSYSRQLAIFPSTSRTTKQPPRVSICQTQRTLGRRDVSFPNEASSVPPARTPLAHAFRRFLSDFWNQNCPTTWSTLGARQGPGQVCIDTDTTVDILGIREGAAGDELGLKQLRTRFWSPPSGFIMPKLSGVQMKQCSTMFGARSGQIQHHA